MDPDQVASGGRHDAAPPPRCAVVLGTSSAVPTRTRNHTAVLVRLDGRGLLVDCGEGTQRQLLQAGLGTSAVSAVALTHAHGDHCFGLPGLVARRALEGAREPLALVAPAGARRVVEALLLAASPEERAAVDVRWVSQDGPVDVPLAAGWSLHAAHLDHRVDTVGYRLQEDDARTALPDALAAAGVAGPDVGRLLRGEPVVGREGSVVRVQDVTVPRPGQAVALVWDTRPCAGAERLARHADLLLAESTFAAGEEDLADRWGHLTAEQAAALAARAGARRLVLLHVSQRHPDAEVLARQARAVAQRVDVVAAADLDVVPVPPRRRPAGRTTSAHRDGGPRGDGPAGGSGPVKG